MASGWETPVTRTEHISVVILVTLIHFRPRDQGLAGDLTSANGYGDRARAHWGPDPV